ncbi:MAG: TonB-dependent receptor [Candidatus Acidiferrales bacterium]
MRIIGWKVASRLLIVSLAIFLGQTPAFAQSGATGAVTGTVLDSSGGVIPGAEIQIVDGRTGRLQRKLNTDSNGNFAATLLPPSTYTVVVNAKGFGEERTTGIEVRVTETTRISVTLQPSQLTQKVEISAQVSQVNTEDVTTGQTITTETLRTLPLATQNFQQLLTLSTGAQDRLNNATQLGRGDVRVFVNGQREDNNNYQIEGISATDYNVAELTNTPLPNPDVLQEFKVQTSLYDASQGRNGGGNVNAVLKSGTKDFHFDAYEFFRNDALNANDFFLNRGGQPRPELKQNIFGASGGGPLGGDAQLGYFFGNYQGSRQRSGEDNGTIISAVFPILPTDRSQQSLSQTFFCNSTTQIDPVILKLLNFKSNQFGGGNGGFLIPSITGQSAPGVNCANGTPTTAPNTGSFVFSSPGKFTDDQFTTNWDREFNSQKDKVAARFFFTNSESLKPFGAGGLTASFNGIVNRTDLNFPYDAPIHGRFLSAAETHVFSGSLVNEFRFGYVRIKNAGIDVPIVKASDLGIVRPSNNITQSVYNFTFFSSGFKIGPTPQADQFQTQNNYNFLDTVSWIHGKHEFRFGGEFTRVNLDKLFPQTFNGQLFFANTNNIQTDFISFLQGAPAFSFGGGGVFNHAYRINNSAFFGQDDYKIRPELTLNLGLRVEINGAFHDNDCHIGNLDPNLLLQGQYPFIYPKCASHLGVAGFTGNANSTTLKNNYSTGLGPRIGLAYDVFGRHTTTIRAGYGIYYVREDVGAVDQLSFQSPLIPIVFGGGPAGCLGTFFSQTNILPGCPNPNPNGLPPAGVLDPAFIPVISHLIGFTNNDTTQAPIFDTPPVGTTNSFNLFGLQVPQHFIVPQVQQWNLTVQRSLPSKWVLEVGYVGTHSIHLRETRDSQQARLATPANPLVVTGAGGQKFAIMQTTVANGAARARTIGLNGYLGFELFANDAYSHYHSLQLTLSRRWGQGYFQGAYTFSRSTDATSTGNTAFNTAFNDQTNLQFSRGLSDFDRTHRLAVSYVYTFPFFKDATGFKAAALRDWGFTGITVFQSGTPFSILDSLAGQAFDGLTTITASADLAPGATRASGLTHGSIQSRLNGYVNIKAFSPTPAIGPVDALGAPTAFGTLGRNIYRGPYEQNWDFSIVKNFHLTERQQLRFATDFFNVWNHPAFSSPAFTDVESPGNFGDIISTENNPRIMQFSLRYSF